ncbi:hypothetical protein [Krasilnikovia sp. M28-CT-15]|uniref:hypothetical protein n=1 Tax=Krasilnikovia sp. M28-CT-15 TaxID=3373540 RepID=UPI003876E7E0
MAVAVAVAVAVGGEARRQTGGGGLDNLMWMSPARKPVPRVIGLPGAHPGEVQPEDCSPLSAQDEVAEARAWLALVEAQVELWRHRLRVLDRRRVERDQSLTALTADFDQLKAAAAHARQQIDAKYPPS